MLTGLIFLAMTAAAQPAPPAPAPASPAGPFLSWGSLSHEAREAENEAVKRAIDSPAADPRSEAVLRGRALGERVGQIVAAGDCEEGERQARAAGDVALARAVRDFCYRR